MTIIDLKVISKKLLNSANLIRAQTFYIYKLTKVVIVSKDKDFILAAFKVVASSLKSFNSSQELLIVGIVLNLSRNHVLRKKG